MNRRKYLVTGGAGFIGSHLCEALLEAGRRVTVVDDLSTGSLNNVNHLLARPGFSLVEGRVQDCPALPGLVEEADVIFHLAAAVGVELVVKYPVRTIETNVHAVERVCELAAAARKRLIFTSTSEVYGRALSERFNEADDLLIGPPTHYRWSYAASKALDEFLALACHKERGLPVTIARLFNTVGPRQTGAYGMVFPRFVEAALRNRPLRVFGDGSQSRCFCHVADTVRALLGIEAEDATVGEIYNIGSERQISIIDLARRVIRVLGSSSTIELVDYAEAYEPGFEDMLRRVPDTDKIRDRLGWRPRKTLDEIILEVGEGLAKTIVQG